MSTPPTAIRLPKVPPAPPIPGSPLSPAVQTAVEYTISQDFAAGFIAEQEKNLQGFFENDRADQAAGGGGRGNIPSQEERRRLWVERQSIAREQLEQAENMKW